MGCLNRIPVRVNSQAKRWSRDASVFGYCEYRVPCGVCRVCRVRRRLEWATRIVLEGMEHARCSVVTLTYRPEDSPPDGGLRPKDLQDFLKSLRYFSGEEFRFFGVGEYGAHGPGHHPHYHVVFFGLDFPDQQFLKRTRKGTALYRSELLDRAWKKGHAWVGEFSWASAQYVAGYVMKKIGGDLADEHYKGLEREFIRVSKMPGLARSWYDANWESMYSDGFILIDGKRRLIPRKFDDWTREERPEFWAELLLARRLDLEESLDDAEVIESEILIEAQHIFEDSQFLRSA